MSHIEYIMTWIVTWPRHSMVYHITLSVTLLRLASLRWRHNGRDNVSNHQPHHRLLNRLFRRISKKTSKLRVTGLCVGNSPGTGEFPVQLASNAENVSIWWRHHDCNDLEFTTYTSFSRTQDIFCRYLLKKTNRPIWRIYVASKR